MMVTIAQPITITIILTPDTCFLRDTDHPLSDGRYPLVTTCGDYYIPPSFTMIAKDDATICRHIRRHLINTLQISCYEEDIYLLTIDSHPMVDSTVIHAYKLRRWSISSNATGTFSSTEMTIIPIRKYLSTRWVRGDDVVASPRSYRGLLYYLFQVHLYRHDSDCDTDID